MNDDDKHKALEALLFNGWAGALHNMDSLLQVVQSVPDWTIKYQQAFDNPLRRQHTQEKVDSLLRVGNEILQSQGDVEELCSRLELLFRDMTKPPN